MTPNQTAEVEVMTRRVCETCEGDGVIYQPSCRVCLSTLTESGRMPCGHPWINLVEEPTCHNCKGTGKIEEWAIMTGATFRRAT